MRFVVIVRPDYRIIDSDHDGDIIGIVSGRIRSRFWNDANMNRVCGRRSVSGKRNCEYCKRRQDHGCKNQKNGPSQSWRSRFELSRLSGRTAKVFLVVFSPPAAHNLCSRETAGTFRCQVSAAIMLRSALLRSSVRVEDATPQALASSF